MTFLPSDFRPNQHTASWPQFILILLLYFVFIFQIGPFYMKTREAFNLKLLLVLYNFAQIILNSTIFGTLLSLYPHFNFLCKNPKFIEKTAFSTITNVHYYYMLLKFLDLLDTVIIVLRKKQSQVTFLHIYHHVIVLIVAWITCKYLPGDEAYFFIISNCFVHIVMYIYYLLTALSPGYIWWKKYVTILQIAHQTSTFVFYGLVLINPLCSYPKPILLFAVPNAAIIASLFISFYQQNYNKIATN